MAASPVPAELSVNAWLKQRYVAARQMVRCVRLLGMAGFRVLLLRILGVTRPLSVTVDGAEVELRPATTDLDTLLQIFWTREYAGELADGPQIIVDAGANVGYAAIFLARRYPNARVIAIEPSASNFAQLVAHAKRYPAIEPIQAALWHEDGELELQDVGEGAWGFRVDAQARGQTVSRVRAVSIPTLMAEFGLDRIDLLKLDIEGSEKEVFEHAAEWIDAVGAIAAELHDKYRPGCARAFYNATNGFSREWRQGENIILRR
ncbi:MAG: FkbM family methyltransferase [Pseudomonadota bacterium]